jgi:dUTP diphosphatase
MNVKIKKIDPDAKVPVYGSAGAACFDLYAANIIDVNDDNGERTVTYGTGLQFEVPEGHVMMVYSRSGHGFKHGITLANSTGVIDADYRGEVCVKLRKLGTDIHGMPAVGERIAQAMIVPVEQVAFEETDELSDTERGEGGFGSTGVK